MSAQQKLAKKRRQTIQAVEAFAHSKGLFRGERLEVVFASPTRLRYADPFGGVDLNFFSEEADGPFTRIVFSMIPGDRFAAGSIEGLNREVLEHLEAEGLKLSA